MTVKPQAVTRRVGVALMVAAVLAALSLWQAEQSVAQDPADPELVQQGSDLFGNNCSLCHGGNGLGNGQEGDSDYGPPLINVGAASVDFMLASGRMPAQDGRAPLRRAQPRFDDTQRAALVAYVTQLQVPAGFTEEELRERGILVQPGADIPRLGDLQDADLSEGRALFTTNCAACHGPTAAGIAVGQQDVSSNLAGVPPLQIAEAVRSGPGVMPVFAEDTFDQDDLEAVVAWVQALEERGSPGGIAVGRGGPVSEGMIAWVVGLGLLGVAVYLLGEQVGTSAPPGADEAAVSEDGDQPGATA